jgi:hypothetical protein
MRYFASILLLLLSNAILAQTPFLIKAEYFIDTDPGHGLATNIPITPDSIITNQSIIVPIASLSDGLHKIFLRTQDANGRWSVTLQNSFVKLQAFVNAPVSNLVKAEYFIDTDPGHGLATNIPITADSIVNNQSVLVPVSTLSAGVHRIFLRTQNAMGQWSITMQDSFTLLPPPITILPLLDSTFCVNDTFTVNFTTTPAAAGSQFVAELSDANGDFTNSLGQPSGTVIGYGSASGNSTLCTMPVGAYSSQLAIRIYSSNYDTSLATTQKITRRVVPDNPTLLGGATTICQYGVSTYQIDVDSIGNVPNITWNWPSASDLINYADPVTIELQWLDAGTHTITVQQSNECGAAPDYDIVVDVLPVPQFNVSVSGPLCLPDGYNYFSAASNTFWSSYTYYWEMDSTSGVNTGSGFNNFNATPFTYTVTAVDDNNTCSATKTIANIIGSAPQFANNLPAQVFGCAGSTVQLGAAGFDINVGSTQPINLVGNIGKPLSDLGLDIAEVKINQDTTGYNLTYSNNSFSAGIGSLPNRYANYMLDLSSYPTPYVHALDLRPDSTYQFGFRVRANDTFGSTRLHRLAWIDFNRDGDFNDPYEKILDNYSPGGYDSIINGTFTIPSNAIAGYYNMRFMAMQYDTGVAAVQVVPGPSNNYSMGETEDYLIRVIDKTALADSNFTWQSFYDYTITSGDTISAPVNTISYAYALTATSVSGCATSTLVTVDTFARPIFVTPYDAGNGCISAANAALQAQAYTVQYGAMVEPNKPPAVSGNATYYYPENTISTVSVSNNSIPPFWQYYYQYNTAPGQGSVFGRYSNFSTFDALATVKLGGTSVVDYTIDDQISSTVPGNHTPSASAVFIDYNRNGIFNDPGELIFADTAFDIFDRAKTIPFTVPQTTTPGWTKVRIIVQNVFLGTNISPRASDYDIALAQSEGFGEIEDYIIAIIDSATVPNANFIWSPAADVTPNTGHQVVATNMSSSAVYTVQATSTQGCTATKSFAIAPAYTISAQNATNSYFCEDSVLLQANVYDGTQPYNYFWQLNADTVSTALSFYTTKNGVYTFTAVDACGISVTLSQNITKVNPQITVVKSNDLLCKPTDSVTLTANSSAPLIWQNNGSLDSQIKVHPASVTTYTVQAETNEGCYNSASVLVQPLTAPQIISLASGPIASCAADTFTLTASTSYTQNGPATDPGSTQTSYAQNQYSKDITNISVNGSYGFSGTATGIGSVFGSYSNYTNLPPITTLQSGYTYNWSLNQDNYYAYDPNQYGVAVFIDFNRDGDFNDANENIYTDSIALFRDQYTTLSKSFNVPANAIAGWTRMRFILAQNLSASALTPDVIYSDGETEDRLINITVIGPLPDASLVWTSNLDTAQYLGDTLTKYLSSSATFTLVATADNGCTATDSINISVAASLVCLPLASTKGSNICSSDTTQLQANFVGGTPPYSIQWQKDGVTIGTTYTINASLGGLYAVTIMDACGNVCSSSRIITASSIPTISATVSNTICNNTDSAFVTLTGAFTYALVPSNVTIPSLWQIAPTASTVYTVQGTDIFGCTNTTTLTVLVGNTPQITAVNNAYTISAGDSVSMAVIASTLVSGPQSTMEATQNSYPFNTGDEEIYSITINGASTPAAYSGANGCTAVAPGLGSLLSRYSNFDTLGALTTVTAGGTYNWSVNENECDGPGYYDFGTAMFVDYNADGDFSDANERVFAEANTLVGPRIINGTFTVPPTATAGWVRVRFIVAENRSGTQLQPDMLYGYGETEDWLINIQSDGPVADSLITWTPANKIFSTNGDSAISTALNATQIYTVTATGTAGCQATTLITINVTQSLSISETHTDITCHGDSNGSIVVSTVGAALPLTFTISPNLGSQDSLTTFTNLPAGNYTVIATDANSNTVSLTINILQPNAITNAIYLTACDSLIWNNFTYNTDTQASHVFTSSIGCDSLVVANISIKQSQILSTTFSSCDSFTWLGTTYYASTIIANTFTNVSGCDSINQINLIINHSSVPSVQNITANFNYVIPQGATVNSSGVYPMNYTNIFGCDSTVTFNVTILGVRLESKVFLAGPFVTANNSMLDSLRVKNLIPFTEPYGSLNSYVNPYTNIYTHVNGGGAETVSQSVLNNSGSNAIVDWVFIQLRSKVDSTVVVATRSALLQKDGDVVDIDGMSAVMFSNLPSDNYFVSIRHRNHLGVMSAGAVFLNAISTSLLDFTNTSTTLYLRPSPQNNIAPASGATRTLASKRVLYGGNCNISSAATNKILTYNSTSASDRAALLGAVGSTGTYTGYSVFDLDFNGTARFNGANPDRLVLLSNCANVTSLIIFQQLP